MAGIDKILILTLERSEYRNWAVLGGNVALQTPEEKVGFVRGHDNKDYDDDMEKIGHAAEKDGFPHVQQFGRGLQNDYIIQSASGTCQAWNYSRILRYIASGKETCLVTWNDRLMTLPFPFMDKITRELQGKDEDFYMWQLRVRFGDPQYEAIDNVRMLIQYPDKFITEEDHREYVHLFLLDNWEYFNNTMNNRWIREVQEFIEKHYYGKEMQLDPQKYVEKYLMKNLIGLDESIVFSPKGAAWMLKHAIEMDDPDETPIADDHPMVIARKELMSIFEERKKVDQNLSMAYHDWSEPLYRRNNFDSWIASDLATPTLEAIDAGKGIYCPNQIGATYIKDWLRMGSTVDWTTQKHKWFDDMRTKSTDINYLDVP